MDIYHVSKLERFWNRLRNFRRWLFCPLATKFHWRWLYDKAKCKRYEPEPPYVWVWMCPVCQGRLPEGAEGSIYKRFEVGKEPLEPCSCPDILPEETVKRTVCVHSCKLPRPFCIHKKQVVFKKGEEPTERCDLHNFKKSGRREEMCSGSLGMFLSFLREAWNPENQVEAEEDIMDVLAEMAKRDIKYNDFFMWLCDNKAEHAPLNDKTPYYQFKTELGKRMFDLSKLNERYWELFDRFVMMHERFGIIPIPQLFMDRYCDYAFKNNINGISGKVLHPDSLTYCYKMIDWTEEVRSRYFGARPVKFINEPRHKDDAQFHMIAVWHRKMYDYFKWHFDTEEEALGNVITDNSGSEAGQMLLVWHGSKHGQAYPCPKCQKPLNKLFPDMLTYPWMDRLREGEQHSVTMIPDFEKRYNSLERFFKSANVKCRWHEDGANNEDAKGVVSGNFRFANAKQYGEACDFVWSQQIAKGNRKINHMCIFAAETLLKIDGVFYETWRRDTVHWERYDEMYLANKKNFG
jgi:hypothetical protein